MRTFHVDPDRLEAASDALAAAAEALTAGELVVLPTETVYGVACRPDDPAATARVFEAKRRPTGLSLPVLVPDAETAWTIGRRTGSASSLASSFWPGALTLVLERTSRSRPWALGDAASTIAVRLPDHPLARALLERVGPIAATSANVSGEPPISEAGELARTFDDVVSVCLVAPEGRGLAGVPSTVVDVTGPAPRVLRRGALSDEEIAVALAAGGEERPL